jgi:hypothetical protein
MYIYISFWVFWQKRRISFSPILCVLHTHKLNCSLFYQPHNIRRNAQISCDFPLLHDLVSYVHILPALWTVVMLAHYVCALEDCVLHTDGFHDGLEQAEKMTR